MDHLDNFALRQTRETRERDNRAARSLGELQRTGALRGGIRGLQMIGYGIVHVGRYLMRSQMFPERLA